MVVQVIGYSDVDFANKEGQHIKGKNIYMAFPDENCIGLCAQKVFIKDSVPFPKDFKINDRVNLSFNHKGKVEGVYKEN